MLLANLLFCSAEFRSYFEHVRALRFDDKPDYDYLKRLFRELFFRKGFSYDNMFDWELLAVQDEEGTARRLRTPNEAEVDGGDAGAGGEEGEVTRQLRPRSAVTGRAITTADSAK